MSDKQKLLNSNEELAMSIPWKPLLKTSCKVHFVVPADKMTTRQSNSARELEAKTATPY